MPSPRPPRRGGNNQPPRKRQGQGPGYGPGPRGKGRTTARVPAVAPNARPKSAEARGPQGKPGKPGGKPAPKKHARGPQEAERLQKALAHAGLGSRRACEELILQGRVTVDGKVVRELGSKVNPGQAIAVDGQKVAEEKIVYFAVYKPKGYVSTNHDPSGRPRVIDLLPEIPQRVYTVGRLDEMSTGLIILTNDGELANRLTHPRFGVEKLYRAVVAGSPTPETLKKLTDGVWLAEGKVRAKRVKAVGKRGDATILEIVLAEGKNREVRRMLAKLEHKVMTLTRVAVGPVTLKGLSSGESRSLSAREIDLLQRVARGEPVPMPWMPKAESWTTRAPKRGAARHDKAPTPRPAAAGEDRPLRPGRPPAGEGPQPPQRRPAYGSERPAYGSDRPAPGRPPRPGSYTKGPAGLSGYRPPRPPQGGPGPRPPQGGPGPRPQQGGPGARPQQGGPAARPQQGGPRPQLGGPRPMQGGPGPRAQQGGQGPRPMLGGPGPRPPQGGQGPRPSGPPPRIGQPPRPQAPRPRPNRHDDGPSEILVDPLMMAGNDRPAPPPPPRGPAGRGPGMGRGPGGGRPAGGGRPPGRPGYGPPPPPDAGGPPRRRMIGLEEGGRGDGSPPPARKLKKPPFPRASLGPRKPGPKRPKPSDD